MGKARTTGSSVVVVDDKEEDKNSSSPSLSSVPLIETSLKDERIYESFTLEANELSVLAVSDAKADKAAAALDVGIGQYSDPSELQGCAHFLEHLLFMGTSKYPDENEYSKFLSAHGGSSNAYTDLENTNYHCCVNPNQLEGALDRLAQFFIHPLLKEDSVDRERQAVHSEHEKNLQQDIWRTMQLVRSCLADPKHPHASFGSGNATTLQVDGARDKVYDFYRKHYSANLMTLVVYGIQPPETLKEWVHTYFSDIPNYNYERPVISPTPFPQLKPRTSETTTTAETTSSIKYYKIVPVEATHSVELSFPMRETNSLYLSKPLQYISHLIGHEGSGSILSYLKAKGWAQELMAGGARACTSWSMFSIQVILTEEGLKQWNKVVQVIFAYLHMLNSQGNGGAAQEWIQKETQEVANCNFLFLSERRPFDYVSSLAMYMHLYPPQHVLSGPYKIYEKDSEAINTILQTYFCPSNMILFLSSPTFTGQTSQKEKWYGTDYEELQVESNIVESWIQPEQLSVETLGEPKLSLPERNDMIATNFDLVMNKEDDEESSILQALPKDQPVLLELDDIESHADYTSSSCRLWYKPDNVFERPKCNVTIQFTTPVAYENVTSAVLCRLWQSCLEEQCNEFTYLASMASLHSYFVATRMGTELYLSGYNHKLMNLLERWILAFQELESKLTQELVNRLVAKLQQDLQNFFVYDPYQHAMFGLDEMLNSVKYTPQERLQVLEDGISVKDILSFHQRFLSRFELELLVHGNVDTTQAKTFCKKLLDGLKPKPLLKPSMMPLQYERLVHLPSPAPSTTYYRMEEYNSENTNSALLSLFMMGETPLSTKQKAQLAFVHVLLKEPAFHELRTEQQLGYIVFTNIQTWRENRKALFVLIQSDTHDPIELDKRVDDFIGTFRSKVLVALSKDEFEAQKAALIQVLLEKRKNLWEESSQYWDAIGTHGHYEFQRFQELAKEVEVLTKVDLLRFWDKHFLQSNRTKLAIQVFSSAVKDKMTTELDKNDDTSKNAIVVTNAQDFKRSMSLYPLPAEVNVDRHKIENFMSDKKKSKDDGKEGETKEAQ